MSRYTYTLHPENSGGQPRQTYRRSQLDKMTTFQLREICRRERLVIPARENGDREGLIRLIMRFRGQRDYRHLTAADAQGLGRIQEFLNRCPLKIRGDEEIRIPGTIILYRGTGMDALDGYEIAAKQPLY